MSIYEMFVQMWELDFQMGLFDKAYFQNLVKSGQLKTEDYQKIVGEAYETTDNEVGDKTQA